MADAAYSSGMESGYCATYAIMEPCGRNDTLRWWHFDCYEKAFAMVYLVLGIVIMLISMLIRKMVQRQ